MLKIAVIIFREFLEITLLLSIIIAATKNLKNTKFYVTIGSVLGVIGAVILGLATSYISDLFDGNGQEFFNIIILTLALCTISWTVIWMKKKSATISHDIKSVSQNIADGNGSAIALVIIIATSIFREGSEIFLFSYSILSVQTMAVSEFIIGSIVGFSGGVAAGLALYFGLLKISGKYIFQISSFALMLIAAGFAAEIASLLIASGVVDSLHEVVWDSSWLISDNSILGQILNTLSGYTAQPSLLQLIFYILTIAVIIIFSEFFAGKNNKNQLHSN